MSSGVNGPEGVSRLELDASPQSEAAARIAGYLAISGSRGEADPQLTIPDFDRGDQIQLFHLDEDVAETA